MILWQSLSAAFQRFPAMFWKGTDGDEIADCIAMARVSLSVVSLLIVAWFDSILCTAGETS